jgi:hypothetical protein
MADCMICDAYAVIDKHLADNSGVDAVADLVADLVSVLPPRGHGMHQLGHWEQTYRSPVLLSALGIVGWDGKR